MVIMGSSTTKLVRCMAGVEYLFIGVVSYCPKQCGFRGNCGCLVTVFIEVPLSFWFTCRNVKLPFSPNKSYFYLVTCVLIGFITFTLYVELYKRQIRFLR